MLKLTLCCLKQQSIWHYRKIYDYLSIFIPIHFSSPFLCGIFFTLSWIAMVFTFSQSPSIHSPPGSKWGINRKSEPLHYFYAMIIAKHLSKWILSNVIIVKDHLLEIRIRMYMIWFTQEKIHLNFIIVKDHLP